MLPPQLSTDLTSLNETQDRPAVVVDMTIGADGTLGACDVYRALVRNQAKLTYDAVGAWLERKVRRRRPWRRCPASTNRSGSRIASPGCCGRGGRRKERSTSIGRRSSPCSRTARWQNCEPKTPNRARDLIESFMVAANGVAARFLSAHKLPSVRRVVRTPERWSRIVDLARVYGHRAAGGAGRCRARAVPEGATGRCAGGFSDLSLSVIKLLGRGEYVAEGAGQQPSIHFALAVTNYTHSTAPNRRFPDLVTQRMLKAAIDGHARHTRSPSSRRSRSIARSRKMPRTRSSGWSERRPRRCGLAAASGKSSTAW